jgi:hypothetical protein
VQVSELVASCTTIGKQSFKQRTRVESRRLRPTVFFVCQILSLPLLARLNRPALQAKLQKRVVVAVAVPQVRARASPESFGARL